MSRKPIFIHPTDVAIVRLTDENGNLAGASLIVKAPGESRERYRFSSDISTKDIFDAVNFANQAFDQGWDAGYAAAQRDMQEAIGLTV